MFYIKEKKVETIEIQKSKFIGILLPINSIDEAKNELELIRKEYIKATHYCYAYVFDNYLKFSDDGEPQGTAGKPILSSLQNNNLNRVLAIVIRYFGGIKLGANGLVRAYSSCINNVINSSKKYIKQILDVYKVTMDYNIFDSILYYFEKNGYIIESKDFQEKVVIYVAKENFDLVKLKSLFYNKASFEFVSKKDIFVLT